MLCRASHTGPAYLSVNLWSASQFALSERKFHRNSGLLDGGLIVLAMFVLMTALVSREWLYVLFAAWLVANLRVAAISAGWDTQWLERSIPPEWMISVRKFTTSAYYVLTLTLFIKLFSDDLQRISAQWPLRIAQWSCLILLLAAIALPYSSYLPLLWVFTSCGAAMIVFLLIRILIVTRSRVALWYSAGLAIALLASLNEVDCGGAGISHANRQRQQCDGGLGIQPPFRAGDCRTDARGTARTQASAKRIGQHLPGHSDRAVLTG